MAEKKTAAPKDRTTSRTPKKGGARRQPLARAAARATSDAAFQRRLERHHDELRWLYMELYDNGDMYSAGTPLLTVQNIVPVKLMIHVSEGFYTQVKEDMPVTIRLDVYKDEKFTGKVSLVYPTIDAATRTFPVEIQLDNKDMRVRPGMFARVNINFGTERRVVLPDLAVVKQTGSGDRYVYVYNDGKVDFVKVELGRRTDSRYEVLSGVPDGARVVVAGQSRLYNGAEVTVVE